MHKITSILCAVTIFSDILTDILSSHWYALAFSHKVKRERRKIEEEKITNTVSLLKKQKNKIPSCVIPEKKS